VRHALALEPHAQHGWTDLNVALGPKPPGHLHQRDVIFGLNQTENERLVPVEP